LTGTTGLYISSQAVTCLIESGGGTGPTMPQQPALVVQVLIPAGSKLPGR
jgi:hypothetical protein